MSERRAVVFDAYGTLFDPHALVPRLEDLAPGRGAALSVTWRDLQLRATWLTSLMDRWVPFDALTADALRSALGSLGTDDVVTALMADYARLPAYPDVAGALARLPGPRIILSNGTGAMLRTAVDAAGLGPQIDGILSSDTVRVYKPAPRVYALATAHLGCGPSEVTFVSGNGRDCAGASAFGLRVIRLERAPSASEALPLTDAHVIRSLSELTHS